MTTRYTQDEWLGLFDQAGQNLTSTPLEYRAPSVGTAAFAKTIDHTLLKLDATGKQVDTLCDEARRNNFKVCHFSHCEISLCLAHFFYDL